MAIYTHIFQKVLKLQMPIHAHAQFVVRNEIKSSPQYGVVANIYSSYSPKLTCFCFCFSATKAENAPCKVVVSTIKAEPITMKNNK